MRYFKKDWQRMCKLHNKHGQTIGWFLKESGANDEQLDKIAMMARHNPGFRRAPTYADAITSGIKSPSDCTKELSQYAFRRNFLRSFGMSLYHAGLTTEQFRTFVRLYMTINYAKEIKWDIDNMERAYDYAAYDAHLNSLSAEELEEYYQ